MMVQALLLLPRLVVTPPARLVVVPPRCAGVRRFTAPGVQLGEDGRPAHGAEQLPGAIGTAVVRGGNVLMCSTTRDPVREVVDMLKHTQTTSTTAHWLTSHVMREKTDPVRKPVGGLLARFRSAPSSVEQRKEGFHPNHSAPTLGERTL